MPQKRFFIELDKAGAEWVVVAYLTGDANMIGVVENAKWSPHIITGGYLSNLPPEIVELEHDVVDAGGVYINDPDEIEARRDTIRDRLEGATLLPRTMSIRQCGKKANHGLNYMEDWFKFSLINEIEAAEAKRIIHLYRHVAYPGLPVWWDSIMDEAMRNGRVLENLLGHKRRFLNRKDDQLWKSMIAYKPQSTIGNIVRRGQRLTYQAMMEEREGFKDLDLLANVHDQLLLTYPWGKWFSAARVVQQIDEFLSPTLETKGRQFVVKTDMKVGVLNWGKMVSVKMTPDINEFGKRIKEAVEKSAQNAKKTG